MSVEPLIRESIQEVGSTNRMQSRRWRHIGLRLIGGLLISASFIIILLRDIQWDQFAYSISQARPIPFAVAALILVSVFAIIAIRWQILLHNDRLDFFEVFSILNIGGVCNVVLPARSGDMVRVVILNQRANIRVSVGLASVLLEKLFDTATLVLLFIPAIIWVDLPRWIETSFTVALVGIVVGVIICIFLTRSWNLCTPTFVKAWIPTALVQRVSPSLESFREGLRALSSWQRVLQIFMLSILIWSANSVGAYLILYSMHITKINLGAAFIVIALINLGLIIPSSPGFIGTYEFLAVSALALFHVGREPALEYAIVFHMLMLLILVCLGLACMARMGYSLRSASRRVALYNSGQ